MSEQRKIVEDAPQMRSVALHSAVPMMPRTAPLARAKPSVTPISYSKPAVGKGPAWTVEQAPRLPSMYFLERTHVKVDNASAQQVASRIVECLHKESVAARYNDQEALVEAESQECVRFAVRLWESNQQVIVEVQRGDGCSFSFHQLAKNVLRSSKGLKSSLPSPPRFTLPNCISRETEEERKQCLREGLEIAASLLSRDAIDSQHMAIDSLVHLTKACKCQGFAAESILQHQGIRTTLFSLVSQESSNLNSHEERNELVVRRKALTVLANCLDSLKEHGKLQACLNRFSSDSFVDTLVHFVSNAEQHPHEACQAVRCLGCLTDASAVIQRRALDLGAPTVLHKAFESCRHAQLEGLVVKMPLAEM